MPKLKSNRLLVISTNHMKTKDLLNRFGFFKFNENIFIKRLSGKYFTFSINKKIKLLDQDSILIIFDQKNLKFNNKLSQFVIKHQIISKYVIL